MLEIGQKMAFALFLLRKVALGSLMASYDMSMLPFSSPSSAVVFESVELNTTELMYGRPASQ